MLRPGHPGPHQAAIYDGSVLGLVTWDDAQKPEEPEVQPEPELDFIVEVPAPSYQVFHTPVMRGHVKPRRRTRKTINNLYAAYDEGIHFSWDITGHEILPHPTLDQLDRVLA
jgi:hypothetical protein